MPKITFILGAGASADGGCPVMSNFIKEASTLIETGRLQGFENDYENVERVRSKLFFSQVKTKFDTENMESLFSAIDMGLTIGRLSELSYTDIESARESFIRLTAATLECTQNWMSSSLSELPDPGTRININKTSGVLAPSGYHELGLFIQQYLRSSASNSVDIITFNYDPGCELALLLAGVDFMTPGTSTVVGSNPERVRLHKLHGSVLWSIGPGQAIEDHLAEYETHVRSIKPYHVEEASRQTGPAGCYRDNFIRTKLLSTNNDFIPYIVPPTDDKATKRNTITDTWSSASASLSNSDAIAIVGYSIPQTDVFFKCFWAISASSDKDLKRIFCIDQNESPKNKIQAMVGEAIRDRVIRLPGSTFSDAMPALWGEYIKSKQTWRK